LIWELKKNVQFAIVKYLYVSTPWKNGELKALFAEIAIQRRSINIIQEIMSE
jgi:hypothetical protein